MADTPKRRGRPPKVHGGPEAAPKSAAGVGHNAMTDDQEQKLTRDHAAKRAILIAAEQKSKADRMNFDKIIKSDLGEFGLENIKLLERLEKDDKEEGKVKEALERQAKVARWAGLQIGTQGSLFDDDRRALVDRAFEEGKKVGMVAGDPKSPYDGEAGQKWMEGWHAGQAVNIKKFEKPDAEIVTVADKSGETKPDEFDTAASGPEAKAEAPWPDDVAVKASQAGKPH